MTTLSTLTFAIDSKGERTKYVLDDIEKGKKPNGSVASFRMQTLPAIIQAKQHGFNLKIFSLHSDQPHDLFNLKGTDVCLVGKMTANTIKLVESMVVANLAAVTYVKNRGAKIILQYSDNWLAKENLIGDFYRDLFQMADYVVFPTTTLEEHAKKYTSKCTKTFTIDDPWQLTKWHTPQPFPTKQGEHFKIIWFGSNLNFNYLFNQLPSLLQVGIKGFKIELTVLGAPLVVKKMKEFCERNSKKIKWNIRIITWDPMDQPNQLESELDRAHLCLIPSNPKDPAKTGVSPNRLVDALRGGCVTVASPMKSYQEFNEISLQGGKIRDLLIEAIRNYNDYCERLTTKRERLLSKFDPKLNNKSWHEIWKSIQDDLNELK